MFELSENSPILETVKILLQDKAVNKKEFPEECARARAIMGTGMHKVYRENVVKMGQKMEQKTGQKRI